MQIHQQRVERSNLERLVTRGRYPAPLASAEEAAIVSLWRSARHHPANSVIDPDCGARLITNGWAGWMRFDDDGKRLIFLFLVPGDFIVDGLFEPGCCDLVSLTPLRTVDASPLVDDGAGVTPQTAAMIAKAGRYYRLLLVDHLTRLTIGCTTRSLAHLLSELHARAERAGGCDGGRFALPIGQRVLARALGRSTVQVNKVIHQFQANGLLRVGYDWIEMLDASGLRALAGMTHSVLQPAGPQAGLVAQQPS